MIITADRISFCFYKEQGLSAATGHMAKATCVRDYSTFDVSTSKVIILRFNNPAGLLLMKKNKYKYAYIKIKIAALHQYNAANDAIHISVLGALF